jgi:GNAT superfamily N-acetyltransferase
MALQDGDISVYVSYNENLITGFTVLLWDDAKYRNQIKLIKKRPVFNGQLLSILTTLFARIINKNTQMLVSDNINDIKLQRNERGFLELFAVSPKSRKQGVANFLLDISEELCREKKLKGLLVRANRNNKPMQALLASNKYVITVQDNTQFSLLKLL